MSTKRILSILLLFCTFVTLLPAGAIGVFADEVSTQPKEDAMEKIEATFPDYKIGATQKIESDGYIGIPVELSIYFDKANHKVTSGYNGTPIIIYVVNTNIERIGTDSDETIITSMLERGYVVVVLDYLNNDKAKSPDLDWSVQGIRNKVKSKTYFTDSIFPSGTYNDNFVVPSGYNVSLYNVFWEVDKHGADGTLEKIVENWNNDFRGTKGEKLVKWVRPDGTRKKTLNKAADGSTVTWFNANGTTNPDGEYTKVKYTVAETITDCVNPDGTPVNLDQEINIIYPTNPKKPVPVMSLASSSGYSTSSAQTADRPQMNGFLFNGYAGAMFDYLYVPMARDDSYGYYDGNPNNVSGAISGDQMTYSIHIYNNAKIDTAAMRYIRYLALSDPETFNFDIEHLGVYGNSKGGWMNLLGEAIVQQGLVLDPGKYATEDELAEAVNDAINAIPDHRALDNHHGETRYDNGIVESYTVDGFTIDGGERQPWLTFDGKEIVSGAQLDYPSNGPNMMYYSAGHVATYQVAHMDDTYNKGVSEMNSSAISQNLPCLFFEVPLGHTLAYGPDMNYGVDTYVALFDFAGYHLKGDAVKLIYTDPMDGSVLSVNQPIRLMFTGQVSADEIEKVTVKAADGTVISGTWTESYGRLSWTFSPDGMKGSTAYTLTVPAGFKGENGEPTERAYTVGFYTAYDKATALSTVKGDAGEYIYFTAPALPDDANGFTVRFRVTDNAANVATLYAVEGFDASNTGAATAGKLLGSVNLRGAGYYEIDVTEYVAANAGKTVAFLLQGAKTAGETVTYASDFSASLGSCKKGSYSVLTLGTAPDGTDAMKVSLIDNDGKYVNHTYYNNMTTAFAVSNPFGFTITEADYGRQFTVKLRVYDTISRYIQVKLNSNSSSANLIYDHQNQMHQFKTVAGEWTEFEFTYAVYDTDYGKTGLRTKSITVQAQTDGNTETPFYVSDLTVTETVTAVDADNIVLSAVNDGTTDYKTSAAEKPFAIYEGENKVGEYDGWNAALTAYKKGQKVVLQKNYTFTDSDIFGGFAAGESFDIDLGGYEIYSANSKNSLFWIKNTTAGNSVITVSNGEIKLKNTSLISYESSTSAGAGKNVSFVFNGVTVSTADNALVKEIVTASTIPAGGASVSIDMNDCNIVLDDARLADEYKYLLPEGSGALKLSYNINGGTVALTSQRWVKTHLNFKTVEFGKGSDGKYTEFVMDSSAIIDNSVAFMRADGVAALAPKATENNRTTYELVKGDLSTKYGIIPEKYADTQLYPFVIFDGTGNFLGASAKYAADNGGGIMNYASKQAEGEWYIVLRRDFVYAESQFNNLAFVYGSVTLDLNGFTFSCQSNSRWLESHGKRGTVTNYTITNGTVEVGAQPLIRFNAAQSLPNYDGATPKTWNYLFDNVKFTDVRATAFVICGSPSVFVNANVTMRNCEFDLTEAPDGFTMFNIPDTTGKLVSDIRIEGGVFTSEDNLDGIKINSALNSFSTVIATKNSMGEYPKAKLPAGASVPDINFASAEGNLCFKQANTENGYDNYTMAKNPLATEYGIIPNAYASTEDYPFAVFKDGQFVGAYAKWGAAGNAATDAIKGIGGQGKTVYILLRRDYGNANKDTHSAFGNTAGTIVFDLGGNTFTREGVFFDLTVRASYIFDTNILVKNGTILSYNGAIIASQYENNANLANKVFNVTFDNVDFGYAVGATSTSPFYSVWDNSRNVKAGTVNITFDGCDFDLTTNAPAGKTCTWFNFKDKYNSVNIHATVKGGTFKANALNYVKFENLDAGNDTVTYAKDENGYTQLVMPSTVTAPTASFNTAEGAMKFCKAEVDGDNTVYILSKMVTEYGTIPDKYASVLDYPFVYFDENGNFKGAYSLFLGTNNGGGGVVSAAKTYLQGNVFDYDKQQYTGTIRAAYVVMRRDYVMDAAEYHDNNAQVQGVLTIDLNGYKLYQNKRVLFASVAKGWSGSGDAKVFHTTFVIKNGGIVLKDNYLSEFAVWDSVGDGSIINKNWTYTYQNVTFSLAEGATVDGFFKLNNGSTKTAVATFFMNFEDCVFDFETVAPTKTFTMFLGNHAYYKMAYTLTGCEIYAGSMANIVIANMNANGTLKAVKNAEGSYVKAYIYTPNKGTVTSVLFSTADGELGLGEIGVDGNKTVFSLAKPIVTKYGSIPAIYSDAKSYPFAVFLDGKFIGAYGKWGETGNAAANAIKGLSGKGKTVYILLRSDYGNANKDTHGAFGNTAGTIVFDLDGHTFTREGVFLDLNANVVDGTVFTSNIIVKNGTVLTLNGCICDTQYVNNANVKNKVFNLTFENVDFGYAKGATSNTPFYLIWDNGRDVKGGTLNITLVNCDFDLTTNAPAGKTAIWFNTQNSLNTVDVNVVVKGGSFYASSLAYVTFYKMDNGDSFVMEKGDDGKYPTLTLLSGNDCETPFDTAEGEMYFVATGENDLYVLTKPHTHSYTASVTAPTCTADGYTTYTCSCGDTYTDSVVPATGHKYDNDFDADCNVCGETRPIEIVTSGEVSRKIFWAFEDGVLTVTGRGKIKNFSAGVTPWSHLADQITKVVIGEGITYIGSSAFYCCANIESVELPETLTAMGNYVFYGCSALKSIEIPAAITEIGKYSFRRSGLETIDFAIGYGWSAGEKEFSIADIISGGHRFISKSYYKQTWTRNVDAEVETLDPNYVAGGIMHTDVIWELTDIGNGNLKLTIRGNGAMADYGTAGAPWYAYWEHITEIEIQDGVTYVGRCAFYGLKFVRTATVAETVTAIGDYGFYMCRLMKEITLPEGVTIGKDAFVKTGIAF